GQVQSEPGQSNNLGRHQSPPHCSDLLGSDLLCSCRMGATVFVQPLDLVKNRMQLSGQGSKAREYRTSFHALFSILRNEGVRGIYTGLSAGLLRQATYTTTRLGIYTILFEKMTGADGRPPNFILKALIGMTAGATGAFVGTPAEVALIRMTADGRPLYTCGYLSSWMEGMAEGVSANASCCGVFGYFGDDILCHFCASMISGLVTTAASMPVDIVKTRIQNMRMIDGKPEYKNGLVSSCTELANQGAGMMSLMLNESEEGVFGRVPVHLYESQSEKGGGFFLFTS
uniref:Solute carrier family 25 member 11 n=1 Tax=Nothobranchius furzeri TaxID=105023 RepID=A0A8C6MER2_NOTFU